MCLLIGEEVVVLFYSLESVQDSPKICAATSNKYIGQLHIV